MIALHPEATAKYLRVIDDLAAAVRDRDSGSEMAMAVRELFESVTVQRSAPGQSLIIDVQGRLAALLRAPLFPTGSVSGLRW